MTFSRPLDTVRRMDTMKILLGATIALLIGALALSLQGMKEGVRNTSPDEIARLKQQVDELRIDKERLQLEREIQLLRNSPPQQQTVSAPANTAEMDAMRAELAATELALREIELEKAKAERDADVYRDEAGEIGRRELEKADNNLRRARLIKDALLMGRVMEYEENEYGDFVTVEVLMPENVRPGTILAIRRNTGILGQLRVADVSSEGAIANIMPGFGPVKPQPGDELILPPQ